MNSVDLRLLFESFHRDSTSFDLLAHSDSEEGNLLANFSFFFCTPLLPHCLNPRFSFPTMNRDKANTKFVVETFSEREEDEVPLGRSKKASWGKGASGSVVVGGSEGSAHV